MAFMDIRRRLNVWGVSVFSFLAIWSQNTILFDTTVPELYNLPTILIFDRNCPPKRVNQYFPISRQNVCKPIVGHFSIKVCCVLFI